MKFSIITPTYNRPDKLIRAVKSILEQDYTDWEMIIVNDSPNFDYYVFNKFLEDNKEKINSKIKYFINKKNMGVNFSRNFALENISPDSDYLCFLDDDDYFNKEALKKTFQKLNSLNNVDWLVENRFDKNKNISLTKNNTKKNKINYLWDYLITKKFSGDATHFISTKYKDKKFSKEIKNAEEWFFFTQLSKNFDYYDFNATYTEGYEELGLNSGQKNKKLKLKNTFIILKESIKTKMLSPKLLLYFILRIFAIILK